MCGIFGSIKLRAIANADAPLVEKGVAHLLHRGPDAQAVKTMEGVCFGHTRLSIIDLSSGSQPMVDAGQKAMISYNGEVYNFMAIRDELVKQGRCFATRSDTEVVLQAFQAWGPACLQKLRGMFAFAVADVSTGRAMLARDRVGKKPLYYVEKDATLYFASELESLYRVLGPFIMDLEALDQYLSWQYIPAPNTIYRSVKCLLPGHYLDLDLKTGVYRIQRYWDLVFKEDRSMALDEWEFRLDVALRDAVSLRLVSDVPFGAFLSGGIDSSLVVAYMAKIMDMPVRTFSIGFENADFNELQYANLAAGICKTQHYQEIVKADSLSILPMLVRHYGQPFADSSAIPTFYVSRMARQHVKMVLSGDGGDENFGGYNTYEAILANMQSPCLANGSTRGRLCRLANHFWNKLALWARRAASQKIAFDMHCSLYRHFSPDERRRLYRGRYQPLVQDRDLKRMALMGDPNEPIVSQLQRLDIMTYLPYDILAKVDIASMANSLEVRAPLLDHVLMETAATMPAEYKLKTDCDNGWVPRYDKKHILKRLAIQRYPRSMIERPKLGFGIPLGEWFRTELRAHVEQRLLGSQFLPLLFDRQRIAGIVQQHMAGADVSTKLWNLLFLDEWLQSHADALPADTRCI